MSTWIQILVRLKEKLSTWFANIIDVVLCKNITLIKPLQCFRELGRLGLIICEDLLWQYPTVDLVSTNKVDTIIFPTEWWDEYPHQLPHVDQASWAKALEVQLWH